MLAHFVSSSGPNITLFRFSITRNNVSRSFVVVGKVGLWRVKGVGTQDAETAAWKVTPSA